MAFWQKHPEREIPVTMPTGSDIYLQTLLDLAEQIRKQLKKMREEQKAGDCVCRRARQADALRAPALRLAGEGRAIFLAQATDDLDEEREQVRALCRAYGIAVLPEAIYPQGGVDFANALEADLARADAFVQLLGRTHAKRPPDMPLGYDRLQFETPFHAACRSCNGCAPTSIRRASAIGSTQELLSGENVLRIGLEGFKADVVKRVGKPAATAPPSEQFVFINADGSDIEARRGFCAPKAERGKSQRGDPCPAGVFGGCAARS